MLKTYEAIGQMANLNKKGIEFLGVICDEIDHFKPETKIVDGVTYYKAEVNGKPEWFRNFYDNHPSGGYDKSMEAIRKMFESEHSVMVFGEGIYWD